jgi:hypothetical protein
MSIKQFLKAAEERSLGLSEMQGGRLLDRLQLAQEFITQDPMEFLNSRKTSGETCAPRQVEFLELIHIPGH